MLNETDVACNLVTSPITSPIISDVKTINRAVLDIMPLALATVPWGILCGSLAIKIGLTAIQTQLMSLLVFAGAAQLASITILGAAGAISSIFSSTFVISSRHLLYSAVFREHVRQRSFLSRCCIAFFLTDEMFAVTCAYIEKHKTFSALYAISAGITFYVVWNVSTFAGIVAGQYIPNLENLGLEFAIAATFIAIVIPSIKDPSILIAVLVSGFSALVLSIYIPDSALIIATITGMLAGYFTPIKE
ncbi:AzlC family ABC transporter permease [Moritella yayanosii]|uniref:Putative branched-chain amino acid transport protein AzlC n=1 Tax=Moritella yayanosii TaxID=69539 RepID=A0A330LQQ1_9GAMM|nr:AzlC family ABC transporter permease [Moritella yayanosii]SQD78506.1 putative branched-chain amino acid transport protein AzlC [Moritella yayanosii]